MDIPKSSLNAGKLLSALLFFFCAAQPSFGETYFVYQDRGGTWYDADKVCARPGMPPDDGQMCWAAAAANVLKWGRWDTVDHDTETSIFSYLNSHWTNGTGTPAIAWRWWLNGGREAPPKAGDLTHAGNAGLSYDFGRFGTRPKDTDGGRYWPSFDFRSYFHEESDPSKTMRAINDYLRKGYGVVAGVERRGESAGHVVTVWGCRTDERGGFEGVFVTNSDDEALNLDFIPVSWDEWGQRWNVPALDGFIKEVWALEPRPDVASDFQSDWAP